MSTKTFVDDEFIFVTLIAQCQQQGEADDTPRPEQGNVTVTKCIQEEFWWSGVGSNRRPPRCENIDRRFFNNLETQNKSLSPHELRVWHAFRLMHEDVLGRVGRDIARRTGLSGPEFGVLSCLAAIGKGEMRQQALASMMAWDKSRLSHQLTRMEERALLERRRIDGKTVLVALTKLGKKRLDAARPIHAASVLARYFLAVRQIVRRQLS